MVPGEFKKVCIYNETFNFQLSFQVSSLDFYFDQQSGEMPRTLRNLKLLIFLLLITVLLILS